MKKIAVLSICLMVVFSLSFITSAAAASAEEDALQVLTTFAKAINDNDPDTLSSLWHQGPNTTTFGPWGRFLKHEWLTNPPPGVSFALNYPEVNLLGDNVAVLTCYFTLTTFNEETGDMKTEYLRETLVVQKIQKKWLIVHEHSSYQP